MPRRKPSERSYARLTKHERQTIERMLDRGKGCREIAGELGRAPSTVANEVGRHRFVTSPRAARRARARERGARGGVPAPGVVAEVLQRVRQAPGLRVQPEAARLLQRGDGAARGRRRALRIQTRHRRDRARRRGQARGDTRRAAARAVARADRGHEARPGAFRVHDIPLGGRRVRRDDQHGAEEEGRLQAEEEAGAGRGRRSARAPQVARRVRAAARGRARRRLGDGHRRGEEGRLGEAAHALPQAHGHQLAIPVPDGTCAPVLAGLGLVRAALGEAGMRRAFRPVVTDNGAEFADEGAIAALLGELPGETRLYYCDPRRADQKGGCEKNHVEIRKILPKGRGISFDRLDRADAALVMSQVNSEPRGRLAWRTPSEMLLAALGEDARALIDAFGIEMLDPSELELTPGCVERARAERGEAPLAE